MVHKETVAQRESARCFLFDLQNLACFQFFNAYFVSLLQIVRTCAVLCVLALILQMHLTFSEPI